MTNGSKYNFSLEIGNLTFSGETNTSDATKDSSNKAESKHILHGLRFNRKIYQPGEIEAEISIKPKPSSITEVTNLLLQKSVKLKKGDQIIAENYYVHEILPQEKKDITDQLFVKVFIFSIDKLMAINKYSKVYVAKKLGSEILDVERKNFTPSKDEIKVNFANMRMLKYKHSRVLENHMTGKTITIQIPSEFIHPYLVQYNETFYDFLARTANRCGEFLYFENGELNLGLAPSSDTPVVIDDYLSVTYQNISAGPLEINNYARDSIKDNLGVMEDTNYDVVKKNAAGYPYDAFPNSLSYNSELTQDEYFFPLYADKFSTFTREMGAAGGAGDAANTQIFPFLNGLLSGCEDYATFLTGYGMNEATTAKNSTMKAIRANKSGFSKYIDIKEITNRSKKLEQGDGQKSAVPFGTLSPEGWTTLDYYRDVRKYEEEVQLQMICIDMDTNFAEVKLGDKIKVNGDRYTVIQILMVDVADYNHSYVKYNSVVTPMTETIQNQKIFAIPDRKKEDSEFDEVNLTYPPVLDTPIVRKAEPQTAFITDNDDPKYQGRVRIVYPWQTESEGKLKALIEAEAAYVMAQKNLEEKQKELAKMEAELNTLKTELADIKSLHEEKEKKNSLRKREKELGKTSDEINKLANEIPNYKAAINAEKQKPEKKQKKEKIKALELEITRAEERIADLTIIEADQKLYIERLQSMKDSKDLCDARKTEIENAITEKETAYKELKDNLKDTAVKDVKNKAKDVKSKIEDGTKALSAISSPWIRVTTPMATEGGGTFFKPRVGDEVLINYDNGNVERPYVIGSLFSKNVLTPDERINRTVGPNLYANASIAIVSPNGHGITFQDPPSGDSFISGVYPGLGVITKYITKVPMPHTKDLAGGIKIGDRYGLYSISMSSDKRSVSISSSMGKVNINAFTGITISAPNGDIKIHGKNVSISAGNNLSITSGTNIRSNALKRNTKLGKIGEFITEGLANVSKVVDNFVTPFIDTTLARATLEVFLRPIEGTLCVKSKRYLTLEAGSGKAIIKPDRFKKYDAEKTSKENDFFKRVIDCMTAISSKIDIFCDTYNTLWKDVFEKYNAYLTKSMKLLADPEDPDILKDIITRYKNPPQQDQEYHYQKEFFTGKLDPGRTFSCFVDPITGQDTWEKAKDRTEVSVVEGNYTKLCNLANSLDKSVITLFNHISNIDESFNDIETPTYIERTLKDTILYVRNEFVEKWISIYIKQTGEPTKKFLKTETPEDLLSNHTYLKRKVAALYIMNVAMHPEQKSNQFIKTGYFLQEEEYKAKLTEGNLTDNYWWSKFAMNFEGQIFNTALRTLMDNTFGAAVKSVQKNLAPLNPIDLETDKLKDRDVWAAGKGGQILFSDQKDATLNFDGGDLNMEENCNNLDKMKKILSGIK